MAVWFCPSTDCNTINTDMDGGAFGHALLLLALATETSAQSIPWPSVRNGYDVTTSAPLVLSLIHI